MAKRTKKITPMEDSEILGHLKSWLQDAVDYENAEVSQQRSQAIKYYLGDKFGNEEEGKSSVVTRDVQETIDWIMPSLMKVFTSGDSVVTFLPEGEEDVPLAEQETDYINHLFLRKNPGFTIMHDWFQDALMVKNGVVKVYVEDEEKPIFDIFRGLDEEIEASVLMEDGVEPMARTVNADGTVDIKIRRINTKRKIKVECVPPEEFVISRNATCLKDAVFCAHRPRKTKSDLRVMGVPESVLDELQFDDYDAIDSASEKLVRDAFDGTGDSGYHSGSSPDGNLFTRICDAYVLLDVDGDGFSELRHIIYVGDHIIENEPAPCRPFAVLSAHRIAHKFFGMSIYDKIKDIQEVRSALSRAIMDNIYATNNGRYEVVEGQVNLDDLLNNRKNGIVRTKTQGSIKPLDVPQLSGDVYGMLDRFEAERGKRTGVTDRSRGLDANTLHSNQAAMSVNQLMSAAEQQIDMIARMFAETGVKDLFQLLHDFALRYQDQEEVFQLRGSFVKVNPASWRERNDLTVKVGIGNMNKDQQLMHLQRLFEMTQTVIGGGGLGTLVTERNIYNLLKELTQNAGYKDVSKFWTDPDTEEAKEARKRREEQDSKPKPDEIKAQADATRAQAELQTQQLTAQVRLAEIQLKREEQQVKLREIALKEAEFDLNREKFAWERARDEAELQLEIHQARPVAVGDGKVPNRSAPTRQRKKASSEG